jgi:muramoyltetrapeptide carboxypeptidase LdcA involved in peptidoglycan recycling
MIKPNQLKKGDTIAVIAPSWGGASIFHDVYQNGIDYITYKLDLNVKEFSSVNMDPKYIYENPEARADDINKAFLDPEVKAIISTIGGSDSIRILKFLDLNIIKENPKIVMGFSDTTTILCYLNMHGLVTYYGNSIMAGFSYLSNFKEAELEYERIFFTDDKYELKPFQCWSERYEPWGDVNNVGKVSGIYTNDIGFRWIQKGTKSKAKLFGGCIEVLNMMNGTFAWPHIDFWEDKYLFIETSEDKPTPEEVGFILRNFGIQGILDKIQGILVAKPKDYSIEEKKELDEEILKIVAGEFDVSDISIISNIEFGHTDPRHIMPLGIDLEIDPEHERLIFLEKIFK